jgi:hypothetical protein
VWLQHPPISSWARAVRCSRMFFDPQPTTRELPTDGSHPRGGGNRGHRADRDRRSRVPPRKVRSRAAWVNARWCAEMLSKVEQHVDHARPHLPRRRQRANVIAIADDLPLAAQHAVDRERHSNGESVHAATGAARLIALDDEVPVVLLNRKVDHTESIERRSSDGASERAEHPRGSKRRKPGRGSDRDLQRVSRLDLCSRGVRHRRSASRLSPRPLSRTTPFPCHLERQLDLPPSCRFDSAHVPLVGADCVGLRGSDALDSADVPSGSPAGRHARGGGTRPRFIADV